MYENKIEQLNSASMRVRKAAQVRNLFLRHKRPFLQRLFIHLGRKQLAKPKCAMVKNFVTRKFMAKNFSPKIQRFKF
jgi:hypothetical protein